jgi:hypothetical protein
MAVPAGLLKLGVAVVALQDKGPGSMMYLALVYSATARTSAAIKKNDPPAIYNLLKNLNDMR